jgi:hypothetical protein
MNRCPKTQRRKLSADGLQIPVVHKGSKILNLPIKDCSYLSLALRDWGEIMETLSGELHIVLEGRFAISRSDLPMVLVFFKIINHGPEARQVLAHWQYLIKGQFEYV